MIVTEALIEEQTVKEESRPDFINDTLREQVLEYAKNFKTSWLSLGQNLYSIHRDQIYQSWGFEKFENYVEEEVGLSKTVCLKLLKTYFFIEQDEPEYLAQDFVSSRDTINVPGFDAINVLRMAKSKKELLADDYSQLRKAVFEKGKDAPEVRKELTSIMKERKIVDPDEERDERNVKSIKKVINALSVFKRDMETLQLLPDAILEDTSQLLDTLQREVES